MKLGQTDAVVAVILPCRNEEEPIAGLIAEIAAEGVDRIIVVDNGSTDRTAAVASQAGAIVVSEPIAGYGRACATGLASVGHDVDIVCFMDGDGSDIPRFIPVLAGRIADGSADFVMGSRILGHREPGSMTPQQIVAGRIAGLLLKAAYGVTFTDMSPFRLMRRQKMLDLGMREMTFGWNLEMQIRVAAAGLRIEEMPVDHRRRRGGVSKVSGNLVAGMSAAWVISTTFIRLWRSLKR